MKQAEFNIRVFSKAVKTHRDKLGLSLRNAAKEIGTSAATLCRIENGGVPDLVTAFSVIYWMNANVGEFYKVKDVKTGNTKKSK